MTRVERAAPSRVGRPAAARPEPPPAVLLTRTRIERLMVRFVAGFGLIFGIQSVPVFLDEVGQLRPLPGLVGGIVLYAILVGVAVAAAVQRGTRLALSTFAVCYLLALAAWPFTAPVAGFADGSRPWLWYLCSVATVYAAAAWPLVPAIVYTVGAPLAYGAVTLLSAVERSWESVALDSVYALVMGSILLVMIATLRAAATSLQRTQNNALRRYATAVREHARQDERAEVDALVHDSVLATLLAAADAHTPQAKALAARMAAEALEHLDAADDVDPERRSETATAGALHERLAFAASLFSVSFEVTSSVAACRRLPAAAADALYAAAVQAMVNSAQHAGAATTSRRVTLSEGPDAGVQVEVVDDGCGFDACAVPPERLGLRVSIIDRARRAGGEVSVRSAPGEGTAILLSWPGGKAAGAQSAQNAGEA